MLVPLSTIAVVCLLAENIHAKFHTREMERTFRQRSRSEWRQLWHEEKHARCRESLVKHMKWACDKDIYRINRRSDVSRSTSNEMIPWLPETSAKRMVRFRRNTNARFKKRSSITNECCLSSGCTWEEYAEYCPTNKRITPYVK